MTPTKALDWRAEQDVLGEDGHDWWVNVYVGDKFAGALIGYLNEPTARLIAAAPDMATELAGWFPIVRDTIRDLLEEDPRKASYVEGWARVEATMAALIKAGRAPQ